jgi:phosphoribosyl-dephospho-CoA transferase
MQTHTLLRLASSAAITADVALPRWALEQLADLPWVVVRRGSLRDGAIPIGLRGRTRSERCAAWVEPASVRASATPPELAALRGWRAHPRRAALPAFAALNAVEAIMAAAGLGRQWGPGGSVGFELASGHATVSPESDLDIVVQLPEPLTRQAARSLDQQLRQLPVRIDVLLETPAGGFALSEYAGTGGQLLVRTPIGPTLIAGPRLSA